MRYSIEFTQECPFSHAANNVTLMMTGGMDQNMHGAWGMGLIHDPLHSTEQHHQRTGQLQRFILKPG